MKTAHTYEQLVQLRYNLYNSLFMQLPYRSISEVGPLLPLLQKICVSGLQEGLAPNQILDQFFETHLPDIKDKWRIDFLFRIIQYVERQVVLFDAIEDAAFSKLHPMEGPGTLAALFNEKRNKAQKEALLQRIKEFGIRIVLTAHPTQFYPGAVLGIITDIEKAVKSEDFNQVNLLLQQLGRTKFYNRSKPTPLDEAIALIWYLENIFYEAIPIIFNKVQAFSELASVPDDLIKLGFWPGGDRDGNPFVSAAITQETGRRLHEAVLRCYLKDVQLLKRKLTFPKADKMVRNIEQRLTNALYNLDGAQYRSAEDLLADLRIIKSLLRTENNSLYLDDIEGFATKVQNFGFHFASLDIRQDSKVHQTVLREILKSKGLLNAFTAIERSVDRGLFLMEQNWQVNPKDFEGITHETLAAIHVMMDLQKSYGRTACHRYIISNTKEPLDLFTVFFFFKICGYNMADLPVDVVPLFETIDDLKVAGRTMETFYKTAFGQHHIGNTRQKHQTIMLGFSDGTKDGGYMAANFAILEAKRILTAKSRKHQVKVLFFDGRGGPPARGGGDTHRFYASMGPDVENHQNQITIQGQTISSKFGSLESAVYNMEQLLTAGLSVDAVKPRENPFNPATANILSQLAAESLNAYNQLKQHPKFIDYLENVTVLKYYGETNIGSRPVRRSTDKKLTLSDLRAIPFVGAWAQMKQNVPGFYGFGQALQKVAEQDPGALETLYDQSEFFRVLVQNSLQSLAKTNFKITQYLQDHPTYGAFWKILAEEFERTRSILLRLTGTKTILEDAPINQASIAMRENLVLPLLIIQQTALMALQNPAQLQASEVERYQKLVVRCFFGNINSSRNSA